MLDFKTQKSTNMHLHNFLFLSILLRLSQISGASMGFSCTDKESYVSSFQAQFCNNHISSSDWEGIQHFEWEKASFEGTTAFFVCHLDNSTLSGNIRREKIESLTTGIGLDVKLDEYPIYNADGTYCANGYGPMTRTTADHLHDMSDKKIIVHPLSAMEKIRKGSFDDISFTSEAEINTASQTSSISILSIHADLCPGAVQSHSAAAQLASDFVNKIRNNLKAEVDINGHDRSDIAQSLYFTASEADSDNKAQFNEFFENASNPDFDCMHIIEKTAIVIETSSSGQSYQVSYEFGSDDHESKVCYDYFIVGLATQKEVCSVEKQDKIRLLNEHAQWILQSGIEEQRPFFDKGLSGTGQVVQVSEYCFSLLASETSISKVNLM